MLHLDSTMSQTPEEAAGFTEISAELRTFYIYWKASGKFIPVRGFRVTLPEAPSGVVFFAHRDRADAESWNVSDARTGAALSQTSSSWEEAIEKAAVKLQDYGTEKYVMMCAFAAHKYGESPNWPQVQKEARYVAC